MTVWVCMYGSVDGGAMYRVCATREAGMEWLKQQHELKTLDAARMTARVHERNPEAPEWKCECTDIEVEPGRIGFRYAHFDHYYIIEQQVEDSGLVAETAEMIERWRVEVDSLGKV